MDELTIAKAKVMRESGMSYKAIGVILGYSRDAIRINLNPDIRDKKNKSNIEYRKRNKEHIKKFNKSYYKQYYEKNKEELKARNKKYNLNLKSSKLRLRSGTNGI